MVATQTTLPAPLRKVPPFPPVAAQLLNLLSDPSVEIHEIAKLIASDATLTARILQCANSVRFGLLYPVSSVHHAVTLMGIARTRDLTLSLATAAYTKEALRAEELRRCWRHTIATAVLAEELAHACEAFTEVAFTAGIMHDIGRLGLLAAYPDRYERTIRNAAKRCLDLLDFEREEFGFDHTEAGRLLSERWGLPSAFQVVAGRHHDPCEGADLDLLRIVHTACRLADVLGYDITRALIPATLQSVLEELPFKYRKSLQTPEQELCQRIEERILELDSSNSDRPQTTALVLVTEAESELTLPELTSTTEQSPVDLSLGISIAVAFFAALMIVAAVLLWRTR